MGLDLDGVEAFVALARHRHFGRAALALHIGTPGLSKRIVRLEQAVGTALVIRGPSGFVDLTPDGHRILPDVERLARLAEGIRAPALSRTVRVGVPGGPRDHLSPEGWRVVAAVMRNQLSAAGIQVLGVPFGADERWLEEDRIDVMLGVVEARSRNLSQVPVSTTKRMLISAGSSDPGVQGATLDDVRGLRILVDPDAHERWMSPWQLGDLGVRPDWDLYPAKGSSVAQLLPLVGECAVISADICVPWLNVSGLVVRELTGIPDLMTRVTFRSADTRRSVAVFIDTFRLLAAATRSRHRASAAAVATPTSVRGAYPLGDQSVGSWA